MKMRLRSNTYKYLVHRHATKTERRKYYSNKHNTRDKNPNLRKADQLTFTNMTMA